MGKKRPLEFDSENEPPSEAAEARFEGVARRLELKSADGGEHKEFSHATGTVQVDSTGVEEFREREEKERQERAAKKRLAVAKDEEKLRSALTTDEKETEWAIRLSTLKLAGKLFLLVLGIYFAITGLSGLFLHSVGEGARSGSSWGEILALLALGGVVLAYAILPQRVSRIVMRAAYAIGLIYLGVSGVLNLIRMWYQPPQGGADWGRFVLMLLSLLVLTAAFRYLLRLRKPLLEAFEDPEHPLFKEFPILANHRHLRIALYTVEGLLLTCVFQASAIVTFRTNLFELLLLSFQNPLMAFYLLYPFFVYLFFRKVFYGVTR